MDCLYPKTGKRGNQSKECDTVSNKKEAKGNVLEIGSCATWNQEVDFTRIVDWKSEDDENSNDENDDDIPSLESEDSS